MLEASVEPGFLDGTRRAPWSDGLYDYGELPWAELVQIYRDTLNLVVFAGLDALGIATSRGRAWLLENEDRTTERSSSTSESDVGTSHQ